MDKELVGISLVVLGVVSGVTFAGHRLIVKESGHNYATATGENRVFLHEPYFPIDKFSSQIVSQYELRKSKEAPKKRLSAKSQKKEGKATPNYLLEQRIRGL